MKVLDVGSGLGGPARNIARLSGATIIGIDCNDYFLCRAQKLTKTQGLSDSVTFTKVLLPVN